jgi:putative oxidoreductase
MNPKSSVVPIARLLLALMFVLAGISKFAGLGGTAGYIASKGLPLPMVLAFATAALEVLGGLAIIVGFHTRIAAIVLALFTLVATFVFHAFWAVPAEQQMVQQLMFMKNLSVAGGLLLLFSFGAGGMSLDARRDLAAA